MATTRTWQQQHARMIRAHQRATSATDVTIQVEDDFYAFFVWCFHLKDWLKNDHAVAAATQEAAEDLVNTAEPLKICADLANGIKHLRADRRPRVDADSKVSAIPAAFQKGAFQSNAFQTEDRMIVVAGGNRVDARQVADDCVAEWNRFLVDHHLM